jgi:hypothetical protein
VTLGRAPIQSAFFFVRGREIIFLFTASRPALGSTWHSIKPVSLLNGKAAGTLSRPFHLVSKLRIHEAVLLFLHDNPYDVVLTSEQGQLYIYFALSLASTEM